MTATLFRQFLFFSLIFGVLMPAPGFAASAAMRQTSQSLLAKGMSANDAKRARRFFEQAIVADPANAAALSALGNLYRKDGKKDLARKYYDLALGVDPVEVTALSGAADMDIAEGKAADARDRLRKLKVVCPACKQTRDLENNLGSGTTAAPVSHP